MSIQGTHLIDSNPRLRFFMIFAGGIVALVAIIYWRQQTLKQADYVEFPMHDKVHANSELRSKNFQLEVQDSSPSAQ